MNADELVTFTGTITNADANFGSAIPMNSRRFIYRYRLQNAFVGGDNIITLGKRENGANVTSPLDTIELPVVADEKKDPEELKEDALPLFIINGPLYVTPPAVVATSYMRAVTSAGNATLTIWYCDKPAMP